MEDTNIRAALDIIKDRIMRDLNEIQLSQEESIPSMKKQKTCSTTTMGDNEPSEKETSKRQKEWPEDMEMKNSVINQSILGTLLEDISEEEVFYKSLDKNVNDENVGTNQSNQKCSKTQHKIFDKSQSLPLNIKRDIAGEWVCCTLSRILHCSINISESESYLRRDSVEAQALLDYTWQKLNTGNWKDIPLTWRLVFTWASVGLVGICLLKLMKDRQTEENKLTSHKDFYSSAFEIVQACDRGLLMGAPIEDNPLHTIASAFNPYARKSRKDYATEASNHENTESESLPVHQEDSAMIVRPLPSIHQPALDHFFLKYMRVCKPVKLLGTIDHWPANRLWNIGYLREVAGGRTIPVEIGARYTDDSWSQALMTMDDFLTTYITKLVPGAPIGYLAQHQLLDQVPELQEDLLIPDYCHMGDHPPRLNAWIGPKGTVSPLHHDPDHNILVQVVGYKYIRLYEEDQTEYLYPHPDPLLSNTSQVDVEGPEDPDQPLLKKAQFHDLILGPGEAVYIPPRCWHYVRSLSISFSVSFWWL